MQAWSVEEYLGYESGVYDRGEAGKHEFIDGSVLATAGADYPHSTVTMNVAGVLHNHRSGMGCRVHTSDMRVRIEASTTWVYPDIAVVCGKPELLETRPRTLVNPLLLVEVLSPSTAA